MRMRRRGRSNRLPHYTDLPLTSLIDTAFTLLIVFMVASPMMQSALKVALPKAKTGQSMAADSIKQLMVTLDAKGKLAVNDHVLTTKDLVPYIKSKIKQTTDKRVLVRADKSLVYDKVIQLIDQINSIEGVQHVALATEHAPAKP